jgi:hypothetical protein
MKRGFSEQAFFLPDELTRNACELLLSTILLLNVRSMFIFSGCYAGETFYVDEPQMNG